jgi:L-ascorbate metabolism protein UlaG (beta-lactamase superfamily)
MSSYSIEVQNLHYNAATQSFDALVVMHEGPDHLKFPTSLRLPIDSDFSFVSKKLVAQAKKQRARNASHLVARTPTGQAKLAHLGDLARQLSRSFTFSSTQRAA